ncbi:hypothetical protein NQZ79_g4667 [Umbelopsis isabellina]|nr:hypothetical protein NQZ79_g4667 [Umbelopsis isabellina]
MLSDRSRRRLQLLIDEHPAGGLKFSERLRAAFSSDTPLATGEPFAYNNNEHVITVTQPMITRRRTRGLGHRNSTSVQSSQETTGFDSWDSQQRDVTSDSGDMTKVVEAILQKLRLSEEQSSQHSQPQLFEHLLALLQLPLNQMKATCEILECHQWPEDRITLICNVIDHHPELFHQNVIFCLQFVVLSNLQQMKSTPGRSLMVSFMQMAKSNSEAFVDGIILPSFSFEVEALASRVLTDLITKAISSSLSREACTKLMMSINVDRHEVNSSQSQIGLIVWNTLTSAVMASLLHIKPPLELSPPAVHNIVYGVRAALNENPKENAHIQLLLVLVTKHGDRIHVNEDILNGMQEAAMSSNSFLKKSILNHIRSLRRRIQPLNTAQ